MSLPFILSQCMDLYAELIDQYIFETVIEAHKDQKISGLPCGICHTRCQCFVTKPGLDIFGNDPSKIPATETYLCTSCQRQYPAARYAPHLEKCMGLSSRRQPSRRAAAQSDRGSASSPYSTSTNVYNGDDKDSPSDDTRVLLNGSVERKRKGPGSRDGSGGGAKKKSKTSTSGGSNRGSPLLKAATLTSSKIPGQSLADNTSPRLKPSVYKNGNGTPLRKQLLQE
ncbi:Ataxin-7-like protein 3 [Tieghemiomyces parasiticus]|uniref:SAGA-associated factor 11 n=1 Tax=Tieghemiomyces parasiticus TaxID=78921 RepID=A0A9W8E1M5_9FUNG|nr:Ataxin-7-like protein 3 [Tieghemiomyces parasiticus]